jgi:purine nucleosidase
MQRLIIDTDPGVDDAHAIMLALSYPGVQVEALCTVAGNVGIELTTANALTILDVMDADVPVYQGCAAALIPGASEDASYVHGSDGLGDIGFPPSSRKIESEPAPQALVRMINAEPGEFTLVTIGPLTNIAVALKLDPGLPEKVKDLVVMGGAIHAHGNTPNLSAEYNIYSDPEAAHIVFSAFPSFTLISWETTMTHGFNVDVLEEWRSFNTPASDFLLKISSKIQKFLEEILGRTMLFGADILTMAVALEPDVVEQAEEHALSVELAGAQTRGQTIVDWNNLSGQSQNARIVTKVNMERFIELAALPLQKPE